MNKRISQSCTCYARRIRRNIRHRIYNFLVGIHEGDIRFSLFSFVCTVFLLFLFAGFFFRTDIGKERLTTSSVLGSELTHALRYTADSKHQSELDADITLFLLPDAEDSAALASFLDMPLYGFYLTGKEVRYLPEYYASLSESFAAGIPYIGGLSFSYNPKRLLYNRTTDTVLLSKDGTYHSLSEDHLYYVIGTETTFHMFDYLSERTFHLLKIQPKDISGQQIIDYSSLLLRGASGTYTFAELYGNYLLYSPAGNPLQNAGEIYLCNSLNTIALFSQLNGAGYFLVACTLLFLSLAAFVRPSLARIRIWFRIFLFHRKKKGKFSLRNRIYVSRSFGRHAA